MPERPADPGADGEAARGTAALEHVAQESLDPDGGTLEGNARADTAAERELGAARAAEPDDAEPHAARGVGCPKQAARPRAALQLVQHVHAGEKGVDRGTAPNRAEGEGEPRLPHQRGAGQNGDTDVNGNAH